MLKSILIYSNAENYHTPFECFVERTVHVTLTIIYPNDSSIDYPLCTQQIPSFSIHRNFCTGVFPCSVIQAGKLG